MSYCKLRLDWRQQPPVPYIPPTGEPQQQVVQPYVQAPQPVDQQPFYQQPIATPPKQYINTTLPNNYGQGGGTDIPEDIRNKWNWGAFLLNWIWGIGNSVWIALLVFVPFVNLVMPFILGAKGNKWAWESKRWDSVEQFQKTQRTWAVWGTVIFVPYVLLTLLAVITLNLTKFIGGSANMAACTELQNIKTAATAYKYEHKGQIPPNMAAIDQYLLSKPIGTYVIGSDGVVVQKSFGANPPCSGQ